MTWLGSALRELLLKHFDTDFVEVLFHGVLILVAKLAAIFALGLVNFFIDLGDFIAQIVGFTEGRCV